MLPKLNHFSMSGIEIIESYHLTKTKKKQCVKTFKPGQRKGKDKRLKKVIPIKFYEVPDMSIYRMGNTIICHPFVAVALKNEIAKSAA